MPLWQNSPALNGTFRNSTEGSPPGGRGLRLYTGSIARRAAGRLHLVAVRKDPAGATSGKWRCHLRAPLRTFANLPAKKMFLHFYPYQRRRRGDESLTEKRNQRLLTSFPTLKNPAALPNYPPLKTLVQSALSTTLGFFYPEVCALCMDEPASLADGFVGERCRKQVQLVRPPFCERCGLPCQGDITTSFECTNCRDMKLHFSYARSAVVAKTVVRDAIHLYKYSQAFWFENFLAGLLIAEAAPVLRGQKNSLLVPVPLYPVKQRERGFNQAETLASRLSAATHIPLNVELLQRVKATATQTVLRREERATNMRGAFAVREGVKLNGERIILVDDVFTTGATTNDCARALRAAGAGEVCVWTVARGL